MTATFQSLQETREPKALKAVNLLGNLAGYAHEEDEAKAMLNRLADAVDKVDHRFAKKWGWDDDIAAMSPHAGPSTSCDARPLPTGGACPPEFRGLSGTAEGGASFENEVRWALDALKRGDSKLARDRLTRILKGSDL